MFDFETVKVRDSINGWYLSVMVRAGHFFSSVDAKKFFSGDPDLNVIFVYQLDGGGKKLWSGFTASYHKTDMAF